MSRIQKWYNIYCKTLCLSKLFSIDEENATASKEMKNIFSLFRFYFTFWFNMLESWKAWLSSWWTNKFWLWWYYAVKQKKYLEATKCLARSLKCSTLTTNYFSTHNLREIEIRPLWQQSQTGFTQYRINLERPSNVYSRWMYHQVVSFKVHIVWVVL